MLSRAKCCAVPGTPPRPDLKTVQFPIREGELISCESGDENRRTRAAERRNKLAQRFSAGQVGETGTSPGGACVIARLGSKKWNARLDPSREAAKECSPQRKLWEDKWGNSKPRRAEERLRHRLRRDGVKISRTHFSRARETLRLQTRLLRPLQRSHARLCQRARDGVSLRRPQRESGQL